MYYIDLQPFKEFMEARNLVPEKYRSFYVRWVRRFLQCEFNAQELAEKDKVACYLDQLNRTGSVKDWQIGQAEQAVKLYLQVFLPEENKARPPLDAAQPGGGGAALDPAAAEAMREMRKLLRMRHYAYRTEQTYMDWVERYLDYAARQGLDWKQGGSVRSFLSHLALRKAVASSTQNQALNALIFFFRETLKIELEKIDAVRAKRGRRLPTVLSVEEVRKLLAQTQGPRGLMLRLTYGGGLRVSETIRLRVQDLDFENQLLFVRSGKGDKDRTTLIPESLVPELKQQIRRVKSLHERDLKQGFGEVWLPGALDRKYPKAPRELKWQYLFPARNLSVDPRSGKTRRHHVSDKVMQGALKQAVKSAEILKHVTVHTLRHSFATHLLIQGVNIREVQELLGHKHVETTMIYTHVMRDFESRAQSPLDAL